MNKTEHKASVQFTEEMKGYVTLGATNFEDGFKEGKAANNFFMFQLTIKTDDVDEFVKNPEHEAEATGWVQCDALGGRLEVEKGVFNLFVDTADLNQKKMFYRLWFHDSDGRALTMTGFKSVQEDGIPRVWHDTTTLYVNILEGHLSPDQDAKANMLAAGILHILMMDFMHQMTTMRSDAPTFAGRMEALEKFGASFAGDLWDVYGPSLTPRMDPYEREIPLYTTEGVKDAEITTHHFTTADKMTISFQRFKRKASKDVVVLIHGLTTSTDMYIMPEHDNIVSYLLDNGYSDVWGLDFRMSNRWSYNLRRNSFNMDDVAMYDYPAAFAALRKEVGPEARIHVICHCLGSLTFMMSLAGKQIEGITSVISNSVSFTPGVPAWSKVKLTVAPFACNYLLGIEYINPWWRREPGWSVGQIMAWFVSLFHRECNVPACHMLSFMWGAGFPALYLHENLHDVTHRRGGDLFGGVSLNYYRNVKRMLSADNTTVKFEPGNPKYARLPDNYLEAAHEIETPILFITGEQNKVFTDSNIVTWNKLEKVVPGRHELHVFPNYGHQDVFMGKKSATDVFPRLLEFLQKHSGANA